MSDDKITIETSEGTAPDITTEAGGLNPGKAAAAGSGLIATFASLLTRLSASVGIGNLLGKRSATDTPAAEAPANEGEKASKVAEAVEAVKEHAPSKETLDNAKEQASKAVKGLGEKLNSDNALAQKGVMVGGAVTALDGARRLKGGLKKDETGKRNLKQAFVGAVETTLGAALAISKFQQQRGGEGLSVSKFTDMVARKGGAQEVSR